MTEIHDFSNLPLSDRNGMYGGNSGDKEGVLINGERWIIKYPQDTRNLDRTGSLSYTTSPLSEYLGSHVYEILGCPVHQTMLGVRNGFIVVACKDLCDDNHTLIEFRALKNTFNRQLNEQLDKSMSTSSDGRFVMLETVRIHLVYNPALKDVPGLREQFYDSIIIDGFINNNDRNSGNWGVIRGKEGDLPCPMYDNGAAFSPKIPDSRIVSKLRRPDILEDSALHAITAFSLDGQHNATFAELLDSGIHEVDEAVRRVTPIIDANMEAIKDLILSIPESSNGHVIIFAARKKVYARELELRFTKLILPHYNTAVT